MGIVKATTQVSGHFVTQNKVVALSNRDCCISMSTIGKHAKMTTPTPLLLFHFSALKNVVLYSIARS